jgi:hypothetical protein
MKGQNNMDQISGLEFEKKKSKKERKEERKQKIQDYNKMKSLEVVEEKTDKSEIKDINIMSGLEFEKLISSLFIKMGLDVTVTKQTADGGIDLIVYNSQPLLESTYIVQCKRWGSNIGEPVVRDLYGVVTAERANKGILITNSNYTNSAINFAQGKPIELIDGLKLTNLLEKYNLLKAVDSPSGFYEDTKLEEELSTILNIVRKDPTSIRLRIKLAYKQIDSVWYGSLSREFLLNMIRDAEDNLNYLSTQNYRSNDKLSNFIRHMSFHQLGYLKVVQGQFAEGIKYYLKANEINSFSKKSLKDPYYDDHEKYNWDLNDFFIRNLLNVITLSNYLGAGRLAQKMSSKYEHRVGKYIQGLLEAESVRTNPYYNFLREEWMNRAIYIFNYWEDKLDLEDIIEEVGSNSDGDFYNYVGSTTPKDLVNLFELFKLAERSGLCSISDEERSYQRKIVDAIT